MPDIKLIRDINDNTYDFNLVSGDFEMTESFDTALIVSLLTDSRADVSEVSIPELRRGWWGDTISDIQNFKIGSKLWLISQSRLINSSLNRAIDYTRLALQWLIDLKFSKNIEVGASTITNGIKLNIKITNANGATESRSYELWKNTGSLA